MLKNYGKLDGPLDHLKLFPIHRLYNPIYPALAAPLVVPP